jgi:hypothetical protein
MTNLIERLHNLQDHYSVSGNLGPENSGIFGEAAARIETLQEQVRQLEAALLDIRQIVRTPTSATRHRSVDVHFQSDFDQIRRIIDQSSPPEASD